MNDATIKTVSTNATISHSVGRNGTNLREDVLVVQKLLNAASAGIKEDGVCGRTTVSTIEEYQHNWSRHPDGKVDVGGMTWKNLLEGKLRIVRSGYIILPQVQGDGYYSYSTMDRQYGTNATVTTLVRICQQFMRKYPSLRVGIGDMSFMNGSHMSPHKTHRNGRNADIRPLRADGKMLPIAITDSAYSREFTRSLVEILKSQTNTKSILFNDSGIVGVTHWDGHDNHLHVSMKE